MSQLKTLGPYTLLRRIAVGGMAELYLAKKTGGLGGFEKFYALKAILPHHIGDEDQEKLMIDEARLTSQLRHDNIITVLDLDRDQNRMFMVMEYVRGHDLSVLVDKLRHARGMLALEIAAYVTREICAGLHYLHSQVGADGQPLNLIHRDVSPQNVLIGVDGDVKLIDFGVAKARGKDRVETKTGIIKGKLKYMAPEYATGNLQDARSDIFAAGLILYELITGSPAYDETQVSPAEFLERIKYARVPHPSELRSDIPEDLQKIVAKSLALHPDKRYPSALEMQHDLSIYLSRAAPHFSKSHCSVYFQSVFQRLGIEPELPSNISADKSPPAKRPERSIEHALDEQGRVQLVAEDLAQAVEKTGELQIPMGHDLEPTSQLQALARDPSAPRIVTLSKFTELYKSPDESGIAAVEPREIKVEFEPIPVKIETAELAPLEPISHEDEFDYEDAETGRLPADALNFDDGFDHTDRLSPPPTEPVSRVQPSAIPVAKIPIRPPQKEQKPAQSGFNSLGAQGNFSAAPQPSTTGNQPFGFASGGSGAFQSPPPAASPFQPPTTTGFQPTGSGQFNPNPSTTGEFQQAQPENPEDEKRAETLLSKQLEGVKQGTHRPFRITDADVEEFEKPNIHSRKLKSMIALMILVIVAGITLMILV